MPLDGGVELIFNLSASVECTVDDSSPMTIDKDFMVGALASNIQLAPTGPLSLFGVRFTPEGLYPFLSLPPVDLSDICVEIEEVWEFDGLGASKWIHGANPVAESLIQAFERFFLKRIHDFREHSLNVENAVAMIRSHEGQIPVQTIADQLRITNRHLERKFMERIGIPPKQLCRIFRFKTVLAHLKAAKVDMASLAVAKGFFDQAHLIHEFNFFTNQSPMRYLAGEHAIKTANGDSFS
jgi:AraC-like DNA-binding protein